MRSGQTVAVTPSATGAGKNTENSLISRPIGASTNRDQCIGVPPSSPRRYCIRSNQPCPLSQSRTSTSRMTSSLSGPIRSLLLGR